jgi:hypothetical protein
MVYCGGFIVWCMAEREFTAYDVDRPRGILSTEDREFLLGEREYSTPAGARRRRQKIRERVTHAMLDFQILQYLEGRDRNQIFAGKDRRNLLASGFSGGFLFLYDALARAREDTKHIDMNLEVYLSQAIEHVEKTRGHRATLDLEIQREELSDPEEIFERLKQDGFTSLTAAELDTLWFSDKVDAAAFASFLNQELGSDEDIRVTHIKKERDWYKKLSDEQD